jgi:pimeloyl-ACP methyl ester carboxylesterase
MITSLKRAFQGKPSLSSSQNPTRSTLITTSDGHQIYASSAGDPTKPHIVFLHGTSLSTAVWDDLFSDQKLLKGLYMVRYDMRGHGRSTHVEKPEAYESKLFAEDFERVCKEFGLVRPVFAGWWVELIYILCLGRRR